MRDGIEYWSAPEDRLAIKVVYITESSAKPPCFADADTLIVNPSLGRISVYSYSRSTHRLVDIPTTFKLTPNNLYKLLRRTLMLIVQYDPSSTDHVKIVETIPFVMDSTLRLSIAARIRASTGHDATSSPSPASSGVCEGYDCYFDAENPDDTFTVSRMLVVACTVMSPVSTDFADIYSVLHRASLCEISIATGASAELAAQRAIEKLGRASSMTGAISALIEDHNSSMDEWSKSIRIIESGLSPEAQLVPARFYDARVGDQCKYVVICTCKNGRLPKLSVSVEN